MPSNTSRNLWLAMTALIAATHSTSLALATQSSNALTVLSVSLDPPNLNTLGVQMLIAGDDNRNASVSLRYRPAGAAEWRPGLPLFRVLPETVSQLVPEQFAGTIFDLAPDTSYEIELRAIDPDGPVDQTHTLWGQTRAVPPDNPADPSSISVGSAAEFQAALVSAVPGDVIVLANGIYSGLFALAASGTADNPIVIRGETAAGAILDGQNCSSCNVFEAFGSYIHVENLTIQNAERAIRFHGADTRSNVVRGVRIMNVIHGIAEGSNQRDFYICDNLIEGRLVWPWVLQPDANLHLGDRGVTVHGDGHVVCHNRISGFGDPIINRKVLARSIDFHSNDILDSYDGAELDLGGGNVRVFENRWTNVAVGISLQPIYGGPAYVLRNVVLNAVEEQIKLKSLGGTDEPSGALIYHNTFVSPHIALNHQAPITGHNFVVMNNLFVGPRVLRARAVEWTSRIDRGLFDFNGYYPDGGFWLGSIDGVDQTFPNFAALQSSGVFEAGGTLLTEPIFEAGFVGPIDMSVRQEPANFVLAAGSNAIDRAAPLAGINDSFEGAGPDLGALEFGCRAATYGPRDPGTTTMMPSIDCRPVPTDNEAPLVSAGADRAVTLPVAVDLEGAVSDDGLPGPPGTLTTRWTQLSGPGLATFVVADALATPVHFSAAGVYTLRLTASDGAEQSSDDVQVTVADIPGSGTGLKAEYYRNSVSGAPFESMVSRRTDEVVDFGWGLSAPFVGLPEDQFSVRWTGHVVPPATGDYRFGTVSDDGVRLWVNRQLVIDNWTNHGAIRDTSAVISLAADTSYEIKLEYYEYAGTATIKLLWARDSEPMTVVPRARLFPANDPPVVDAGPDQAIDLPASAMLRGRVSDDGYPNPPGLLTMMWTHVSGPGTAMFTNVDRPATLASFSVEGLYVLRLTASDGEITVIDDVSVTVTLPASGTGTGLTAEYFNDTESPDTRFATLAVTRTDPTVNFEWDGAPAAGIQADNFSVRWTGQVLAPVTGTYTFTTLSDDGVRLWVGGQLVIDNWTNHAATLDTSSAIALEAGTKYDLAMEFYDVAESATAKLAWTLPGQPTAIVPQSQLYPGGTGLTGQYYNDSTTGIQLDDLVLTRTDSTVDFEWASASPGAGVPADRFSVRWTGQVLAPVTGPYTFSTFSDDGVRLWMDGQLVIDNWTHHGSTLDVSAPIELAADTRHEIRMEYYDVADAATAKLGWSYPGQPTIVIPRSRLYPAGTGLTGHYYNDAGPAARFSTLVLTRPDATVDFDWGYGTPSPTVQADNFSVRWTGQVLAPVTGHYMVATLSDDGVRLWVDGRLVIDNWTDHAPTTDVSEALALVGGVRYDITLEYYDAGDAATVKLGWTYPGQSMTVIPTSELFR